MIVNMPKYIIDNVPMRSVAEHYGFELSRGGRIKCPFHDDRNPSMKIYEGNRGYYCFACNRGGNVINFVSELFNIEKRDAMLKINEDFHLGIVCEKPTLRQATELSKQVRKREIERRERERIETEQNERRQALLNEWIYLDKYIRLFAPKLQDEMPSNLFFYALNRLEYVNYLISTLP